MLRPRRGGRLPPLLTVHLPSAVHSVVVQTRLAHEVLRDTTLPPPEEPKPRLRRGLRPRELSVPSTRGVGAGVAAPASHRQGAEVGWVAWLDWRAHHVGVSMHGACVVLYHDRAELETHVPKRGRARLASPAIGSEQQQRRHGST